MAGIIAYFRVSTAKQGESGLGLEGQAAAVEAYSKQTRMPIVARYTEVESGKRADRPELVRALAHAKRSKGIVTVAKLDRLTRNAGFMCALCDSGVRFVACDNPNINEMTAKILAVVAEAEAKSISERTKTALAAAKARGTLLGSARPGHWDGREEARLAGLGKARAKASKVISARAVEAYADLRPMMAELRGGGASLQAIADKLNTDGHTTRRGRPWMPMQVGRVLERAK